MADRSNPQIDLTHMVPYEILRDILHRVAFIPHEWDVGATSIFPGLFCSWDNQQSRAWRELLPLRIAITRVSRRWRAVALEFLHGSFHNAGDKHQLESFASLLSAYPHYGTLVKRLTIPFVDDLEKHALVTGILKRCPKLLILSVIDIYSHHIYPRVLSNLSILPTSLKQLDANVAVLSVDSIFALLAHLPQLEILFFYDIGCTPPITNNAKTVLPNLRILQLVFSSDDSTLITWFVRSLQLPLLSAMGIGVVFKVQIPVLPKDLSSRLEYLGFCLRHGKIGEWEAEDFHNLRLLRLSWNSLSSVSLRSYLPMNQIVKLTCEFPFLVPDDLTKKEVDRVMNFLLDPSMMPKLKSLHLDIGEATWDQVEIQEDRRLTGYFEALSASFDQRGVDLWFDRPHLLKESSLVRDMTSMRKTK